MMIITLFECRTTIVVAAIPRQKEKKCDREPSEAVAGEGQQLTGAEVMVGEQDDLCEVWGVVCGVCGVRCGVWCGVWGVRCEV